MFMRAQEVKILLQLVRNSKESLNTQNLKIIRNFECSVKFLSFLSPKGERLQRRAVDYS